MVVLLNKILFLLTVALSDLLPNLSNAGSTVFLYCPVLMYSYLSTCGNDCPVYLSSLAVLFLYLCLLVGRVARSLCIPVTCLVWERCLVLMYLSTFGTGVHCPVVKSSQLWGGGAFVLQLLLLHIAGLIRR
jgi:hypothetical protein